PRARRGGQIRQLLVGRRLQVTQGHVGDRNDEVTELTTVLQEDHVTVENDPASVLTEAQAVRALRTATAGAALADARVMDIAFKSYVMWTPSWSSPTTPR